MPQHHLDLVLLPDLYVVCRLPADASPPPWAAGEFVSITRTPDELSLVCRQDAVPAGIRCEAGWRCLRVAGRLDFALVGVLASLLVPLAGAGVSVFVASTFDTDYLLIREADRARATEALQAAGHTIRCGPGG
jgi:hypothetical protein